MTHNNSLPVLLLTGYLGSGKTTLLNRILNNRRGIRFAVIVNDIGEVNIDADLIARGGVVSAADDSLVPLQNGCICCTLQSDLIRQLSELAASGKFDYVVIEASGICEPEPIAQTICSLPVMSEQYPEAQGIYLDCIVSVTDALRLRDEFASGKALKSDSINEDDIENLIIQQIEFCNIVLLNKTDEVSPDEAREIKSVIRALQPKAEIIDCNYCDVPLESILDTKMFDFDKVATSATWIAEIEKVPEEEDHEHHHEHEHEHHHAHEHGHHQEHHHHHHHGEGEAEEYGIGTFVYYARRPFSLNKFDWLCAKNWPKTVIRCKGVCYFKENPDMSYLFEQAGRQMQLNEAGKWFVTAPPADLEILLARDPNLMRDWDDVYGDRMQKLVFIGRDMDRDAIRRQLDDCLTEL